MDRFDELTVFLRVVETSSFSGAARALSMSPSAVSKLVARLEATCDTPVGAYARLEGDELVLDGYAGAADGSAWVRDTHRGAPAEPAALGAEVGERMLAAGARRVLDG